MLLRRAALTVEGHDSFRRSAQVGDDKADAGITFLMMNEDERATWRALPNVVTVYRGCSKANLNGLSWSLDRDIAAKFPALDRYMPPSGSTPLLVTADVAKGRITAVNLGRNEHEIITLRARGTGIVEL